MKQWMLDALLIHEGGYVNHPSDPGGETKYGISKRAYPNEDIKGMTIERAGMLYSRDYWSKPGLSLLNNDAIGYCVLDFGVNAGPGRAVKALQRCVGAKADGALGPATAAAVHAFLSRHGASVLIKEYQRARVQYYVSLRKPEFLAGWLNRTIDVTVTAALRVTD